MKTKPAPLHVMSPADYKRVELQSQIATVERCLGTMVDHGCVLIELGTPQSVALLAVVKAAKAQISA